MIIIWQLNCKGEGGAVTEGTLNPDETNKENWTVYKMLRFINYFLIFLLFFSQRTYRRCI